jgi:hypothetical protein
MSKSLVAFGACCALFAAAAFSTTSFAQSRGGSGSACGPAGYVHEVSGAGTIKHVAAKEATTKVGDQFESETVFRTGPDEKTILKFADGQVVALGPDSALRIGRYCYVAGDVRQSISSLELMQGEMRVVTGIIGETYREGVRITAGDSMLSILKSGGADFTVMVKPEPEEVGAAVVARGEISDSTRRGNPDAHPLRRCRSQRHRRLFRRRSRVCGRLLSRPAHRWSSPRRHASQSS